MTPLFSDASHNSSPGDSSCAQEPPVWLRGVRGATQLDADTPTVYAHEVARLMQALIEANDIAEDAIVSVFFTVTPDLRSDNPARIAREALGWSRAPMLCGVEPQVDSLPPRCVRVLIQFYSARATRDCRAVYLNGAAALRPDLRVDAPA